MAGTTEIKRWLAVLLSLTSPAVGMLYLGRRWLAGVMVLLGFAFEALMWLVPVHEPLGLAALGGGLLLVGGITLGLGLRALLRTIKQTTAPAARWRSWPVLMGLWALLFLASPDLWLGRPFRSYTTASSAMAPALAPGDFAMAEMARRPSAPPPRAGDVVVFRQAGQPGAQVRRVVALAGEEVRIAGGVLHINGTPVRRERLPDREAPPGLSESLPLRGVQWWRETLPNGRSYITLKLADAAPADEMAALRVPPGHVFVLGDHRDNALDSRMAHFGPVPANAIVGRLMLVEWSEDPRRIGRPVE